MDKQVISEEGFNTFISIEFFDHETKTTELSNGFKPNYATQFAFWNEVNDFYLNHLDRWMMQVELYLSKGGVAESIGKGFIVL